MTERAARFVSLAIFALLAVAAISCARPALAEPGLDAGAVVAAGVGTSPSVALPDPDADPAGFFAALYNAGKSKNYRLLAVLALMGSVWALRRYGSRWFAGLGTDRGGALSALLLGIFGSYATALAASAPIGWGTALDGLVMGITAAGGWTLLKRLFWPKDTPKGLRFED